MASDPQPIETLAAPEATPKAATGLEPLAQAAQSAARERLEAAWSMRVSLAEELLREGAGAQIGAILDESLAALRAELVALEARSEAAQVQAEAERTRNAAEYEARLAAAVSEASARAAASLTATLNAVVRRLRAAERHEEWSGALYDAASLFASRAAVFSLHGRYLNLDRAPFSAPLGELPLADAPALKAACDAGEPVVALYSEGELSAALVEAFGQPAGTRAHIFPLHSGGRAVGVLYAEGGRDDCDSNALELLATLAASVWESRRGALGADRHGPQLVTLQPAGAARPAPDVPLQSWSTLPAEDRDHHLRAQRFARVRVAEMRLYKSALVLEGRRAGSLYRLLQTEIDSGRREFGEQFLNSCESMADYFHLELVKTLANDDEALLGEGYPGPSI